MIPNQPNPFWENFEKSLPAIIPRKMVKKLTGGLISSGYIANMDSKGLGPKNRIKIAAQICYGKEDFILWLKNRTKFEKLNETS